MRFILMLVLFMIVAACATKPPEPVEEGTVTLIVMRIKKADLNAALGEGESLPELQAIDVSNQEFFAQHAKKILSDLAAPNPRKNSTRKQVIDAIAMSPMMVMSEDQDRIYTRSSSEQNKHVLVTYKFIDGLYDGLEIR